MDITDHIAPKNGKKFILGGLGTEHCQSILREDGGIDFVKNRHYEAFRLNGDWIDRGEDTSLISSDGVNPTGTFYVLKHIENGKLVYGGNWILRDMRVGQTVPRSVWVVGLDYTGREIYSYPDNTSIKFTKHWSEYKFPSGIVVPDVIELEWIGEEHYLYAKDHGLVGWRNTRTGLSRSYITSYNATIQPTFKVPIKRPIQKTTDIPVYFTPEMLKFIRALHEI